jgi:hypothetical protein
MVPRNQNNPDLQISPQVKSFGKRPQVMERDQMNNRTFNNVTSRDTSVFMYVNKQNCKMLHFVFWKQDISLLSSKLWIEKTNDLVDIETDISRNLKGLVAIEIATAVSLAGVETAIWFFETQPRRERELDR